MTAAAFTIVQDDPEFLDLWLRYYGRFFLRQDLYVLDHGFTTDRAAQFAANVIPVHREVSFDHGWLRDVVERFQRFLLMSYDHVVFAEVDEFLVPKGGDLGAYVAGSKGPRQAVGLNVVHLPQEYPIDLSKPVLWQRTAAVRCPMYDKVLVSDRPLMWSVGFHTANPTGPTDSGLYLLHLHRVDYDLCLKRHSRAAARKWNPEDVERGWGRQNRVVQPDEFRDWFYNDPELGSGVVPLASIPPAARSVL